MGYLDKQSRVVDIVLTERGRRLYATGKLDFSFFGLFDDGVDYDPYSTGSLSDAEREEQIEATPMLEAPFIRDVRGTVAPLEPISHVFTAAAGYENVPHMIHPSDGDELSLRADQRRSGTTYSRTGTNIAQIDLEVVGDSERGNPGFIIRVLASGSNGLQPLDLRRDLAGRRSYDPFVALAVDSEPVPDKPEVGNPASSRAPEKAVRKR